MNHTDPIVDEVRQIREAHAAQFHYDLKAIYEDVKKRERLSGRTYVSFARGESKAVGATKDEAEADHV